MKVSIWSIVYAAVCGCLACETESQYFSHHNPALIDDVISISSYQALSCPLM